jgi:hypothetical protein
VPVDLGFPTQTVVVLRQDPPNATEPAVGAQVVVEDCETGVRYEAVTNDAGVATVEWGGGTCWNVTAALGDEARSVLGGPVPLPGPIVMPYCRRPRYSTGSLSLCLTVPPPESLGLRAQRCGVDGMREAGAVA